jgi:A/G-specific adenine glycosylase
MAKALDGADREAARLCPYSRALLNWYDSHRRTLPWRLSPTPYRVWVSEIMLQQTRIEAALPYFDRFMAALPDVADLAACGEDRLLKLWEGLGYYSRARNLQKAAKIVMERYGGEMPGDFEALRSLPGIGDYTAGAVASIAFGLPVPAVDGNVLRVLARLTASREDVMKPAARRYFTEIAAGMLPADSPGRFNQAIMELGETVCLPNADPRCGECPLAGACRAREEGIARSLPVRAPKKPRRIERRTVLVLVTEEPIPRVLLHRRGDTGLLSGLWELPNAEGWLDPGQAEEQAAAWGLRGRAFPLPEGKHIFSHIEWHMHGFALQVAPGEPPADCVWAAGEELAGKYALPSAFRPYSARLPDWLKPRDTR